MRLDRRVLHRPELLPHTPLTLLQTLDVVVQKIPEQAEGTRVIDHPGRKRLVVYDVSKVAVIVVDQVVEHIHHTPILRPTLAVGRRQFLLTTRPFRGGMFDPDLHRPVFALDITRDHGRHDVPSDQVAQLIGRAFEDAVVPGFVQTDVPGAIDLADIPEADIQPDAVFFEEDFLRLGDAFADDTFIIRLTLVITAIFFAVSSVPIFLWLRERAQPQELPPGDNYLTIAFKRLWATIKRAGSFKEFLKFMIAFLVYNDGLIMALDFAAIIGAVLFGLDQTMLIVFVIIIQITNVVGAFAFGLLVDRIGGKRSLMISLVMMIGVVIWLYFNQTTLGFFLIGAVAGVAMAGAQSVSRTMVALFAPPGQSAEFYGFFAMTGRTSSFIGPLVYGVIAAEVALWFRAQGLDVTQAEQSGQRFAILSIAVFLLAGLIILSFVNEDKARAAAQADAEPPVS